MYVSQGILKGIHLPQIHSNLRPVTGLMRKFIFSVLDFKDYKILDLFAGTGSLGFEALSAGATFAMFIDKCKNSILEINKFIVKHQLNAKAICCDVLYTPKLDTFEYIFLDPPYASDIIEKVLAKIRLYNLLSKNGIILIKTNYKPILELTLLKEKVFGESIITIWQI